MQTMAPGGMWSRLGAFGFLGGFAGGFVLEFGPQAGGGGAFARGGVVAEGFFEFGGGEGGGAFHGVAVVGAEEFDGEAEEEGDLVFG